MSTISSESQGARHRVFTYPADFTVSGRLVTVARVREELEYLYDVNPQESIRDLGSTRPRVDVFTFWQRLPHTVPIYEYEFEWDNVAAIPISSYEQWYKTQIHQNARNKVRKAEKSGIEVRPFELDPDLAAGIAAIFNETQFRQGRRFTHFGVTPEQVLSDWSAESDISTFIGAFHKGELVGFIKLLHAGTYYRTSGTVAKLAFRDKSPMNALLAQSVRICAERGVPHLVYGKFVYGAKGEDSLTQFKRHNGFQQYDLPRYFVPLTAAGAIAIKCGFHRPLRDVMPSSVARALVTLRNAIHRHRQRSADVSSSRS